MNPIAKAEWDKPTHILTHEPGIESLLVNCFPAGGLCQGPCSITEAREEHRYLLSVLKQHLPEASIETTKSVVLQNKEKKYSIQEKLRELVSSSIKFNFAEIAANQVDAFNRDILYNLAIKSNEELLELYLLQPKIDAKKIDPSCNTGFDQDITIAPQGNFIFSRDPGIITDQGFVLGKMNSHQRSAERELMQLVMYSLDIEPMYTTSAHLEGGDFFPAGERCFIGVGLRSSLDAALELLKNHCLGYKEVVLVIDKSKTQDEMHLDTYFNITSERKCLILEDRLRPETTKELQCILFLKDEDGSYVPIEPKHRLNSNREKVENFYSFPFSEYLSDRDFRVIPVTKQEQNAYALNFLTIAPDKVVAINMSNKEIIRAFFNSKQAQYGKITSFDTGIDYDRLGQEFKKKLDKHDISAIEVPFNHMNMMYGGIHCCTQVIRGWKS